MIFERFIKIGSATELVRALRTEGVRGKQGKLVDKGYIYKLLNNRVYRGDAVHKGTAYAGEHEAIVSRGLWDKAHAILGESPRQRAANTRAQEPALLKGIIFTETGVAMTPTATKRRSRLYRYYTSMDLIRNRSAGPNAGPQRLAAGMVEEVVIGEMRRMIRAPEVAARTIDAFHQEAPKVDEQAIIAAVGNFDQLWDALFPVEQARIVRLLVERVTIGTQGIAVDLRSDGVGAIVRDMITPAKEDALA
jgi:site-specific DNA recombinase